MKKNTVKGGFLLMLCLGAALSANAQTPSQKARIIAHTDTAALKAFAKESHTRFEANYKLALQMAEQNGWPLRIEDKENGSVAVLTGVKENGMPIYKKTSNIGSAFTSRVTALRQGGILNYQLHGQDMVMGMWEIGAPLKTHGELAGRITTMDGSSSTTVNSDNRHATHVAGTMIGSGSQDNNAKGIAFAAELLAYDSWDDITEAADAAADGLLISNHSYGLAMQFAEEIDKGGYTQEAKDWDIVHVAAPYYQAVMAAGNDRQGTENDELLQESNAKNLIVVAAVEGLSGNYGEPQDVVMSSFSSWGPTDDRRIKPDISAKGVDVWSTVNTSNNAHDSEDGTSMAAPGVAGALILMQQHYMESQDIPVPLPMRAATLKGLMTHTADEAGDNDEDGPDIRFGWGLINATKAVRVIDNDNASPKTALIEETLVSPVIQSYEVEVEVSGDSPLKATIAWTDPAGQVATTANSTAKKLKNDLDLRIYKMNGEEEGAEFLPWRLKNTVTDGAEKGDNTVDNIEVVEIKEPEPGIYKIKVTYKGTLGFEAQAFSLIVDEFVQLAGTADSELATKLSVFPNPVKDVLHINIDSSVNTSDCVITMHDIQGRQIKQFNKYVETINISELSSGVYVLNIATDGGKTSRKIVVE